jgi:phosphocarrier protein
MKSFSYTIKDKTGIHARPAGFLSRLAKEFESEILIEKDGQTVNASKLIMLMGLGVKCGDTVKVTIEGKDEQEAEKQMLEFFRNNL